MPSLTTTFVSLVTLSAHALAGTIPRDNSNAVAIGTVRTGDATYYDTGNGGTGSCGTALYNSANIVALSQILFDPYTPGGNPNKNSLCGSTIAVTSADGSKTVTVTVQDRCTACAEFDLDMTSSVFNVLVPGGVAVGRTNLSWKFVSTPGLA